MSYFLYKFAPRPGFRVTMTEAEAVLGPVDIIPMISAITRAWRP